MVAAELVIEGTAKKPHAAWNDTPLAKACRVGERRGVVLADRLSALAG